MLNVRDQDSLTSERVTVYHLCKAWRRQRGRVITSIIDEVGNTHTTQGAIMDSFFATLAGGYQDIPIDEDKVGALCGMTQGQISGWQKELLEKHIEEQDLRRAVQGAGRKTPGMDGIPTEFYRWGWTIIKEGLLAVVNVMFHEEHIIETQARGIIVCVPKTKVPRRITDYRSITLLNADYKIYGRILANRMRMVTPELLHTSQYCARAGTIILDATAGARDIIAHGEMRAKGLSVGFGLYVGI